MEKKVQPYLEEITLKDLLQRLKGIFVFLISKWVKILFAGIIGAFLGLGYAFLQPVKYVAKLSFVVEDTKSGAGGLASLAGQFGLDLGGGGSGGVFSGDNILLFLKSEGLIRETLMTFYDQDQKVTLADQYAIANNLQTKWKKNKETGEIDFAKLKNESFPRKEDSLIQIIISNIRKSELSVGKPDKKASFIEVKAFMRDELLSKLFVERLVKIAIDRYVKSKTSTKTLNVEKLQRKADSLSAILNNKTFAAAINQQSLVDANPALRTAPIQSEISSRDKTMTATIFAEVVKNLELSRTILNQETPVIQIVDESTLPLPKQKTGKLFSLLFGGIVAGLVTAFFLLSQRWLKMHL